MKTFTAPLQQGNQVQMITGQKLVPTLRASIYEIMAILVALIAATVIVMTSVWLAGLEMTEIRGAGSWVLGFIFLGLAVDNRDPRALLQLLTGGSLLVLAWLQTSVSADFFVVSALLVASWVALSVYKSLCQES